MLKKLHMLVLFLGITLSSLFAQIPAGYYSTATGTGYTLKTQLYNIIKGQTDLGYAGLWTTYQTSDRDYFYENDGSVLDLYSENPTGVDPYKFTITTGQCGTYANEGDCYNREHMIPQSIFNEASPMVADAHFITPTDGKVNGMRSNYPHGMVGTATYTSKNGSKLGSASNSGYAAGYTGTVFEPIDAFKGDIARMYFYFATRYENVITTWGTSYAMFNGTTNQVFTPTFLSILLAWNTLDPVSPSEIARNNAIYARQNNRNPFIDHPEYVNQIWSTSTDTQAPTAPTNLAATSVAQSTLTLGWTASTDNVGVTGYDVYKNGTLLTSVTTTTYNVTGLTAATAYSFYVKAKDAAGNISAASTTINVTTASSTVSYCTSKGNSVTDEWISKVVVGTFTNTSTAAGYTDFTSKTITLTAGTAASISLTPGFGGSAYNEYWRIWIDYNGDKDFDETNELAFDAGAVSNTTKTGTINVISTASGTTRMRVSMKYNAAPTACEAFSYGAVEDFTVTFGTVAPDTQSPTVPTSLAASSVAQTTLTLGWTASTDNVGVTGYDVYKNGTLLTSVTTTTYNVTGLTAATAYTFYVKAKDAAGNVSVASTTVNATTLAATDTQAPTAPTSLAASSVAQTTLTLGWIASTDNVGVTGYDVYKNGTLLTSVTTTTYNVTGLTAATAYTFYVKAKDAAGNVSAASSTINVTTLAVVTSSKETFANFSVGASYLTGTFTGQDGSTWSYNGARGDIAITGSAPTIGKGRTPLSYVASGTIQGGIGTLKFDYMMAFSTTINLNVYVNNVLVKTITGGTINVIANSGIITVNTSGAFTLKFEQVNSTSGQVAIDNIEWTPYTATLAMPKGTNNTDKIDVTEFKLFPNPATDAITISTNSSSVNKYTLVDILGKIIESGNLVNEEHINVSALSKGLYFVKVSDDKGKNQIMRFLKQ